MFLFPVKMKLKRGNKIQTREIKFSKWKEEEKSLTLRQEQRARLPLCVKLLPFVERQRLSEVGLWEIEIQVVLLTQTNDSKQKDDNESKGMKSERMNLWKKSKK